MRVMITPLLLVCVLLGCSQAQKTTALTKNEENKATITAQSVEGGDAIIQAGAWGFSVYDPSMGQVDYFTSKGSFLGMKKAERGRML